MMVFNLLNFPRAYNKFYGPSETEQAGPAGEKLMGKSGWPTQFPGTNQEAKKCFGFLAINFNSDEWVLSLSTLLCSYNTYMVKPAGHFRLLLHSGKKVPIVGRVQTDNNSALGSTAYSFISMRPLRASL